MRPGVLFCAAAAIGCLLVGGPSVAAASPLIQPDVDVPLPATHLSPSGARAALGSVAGRLNPGNVLPNEQQITIGPLTFVAYPFNVAILPPGERTLYFCAASVVPLVDTGVHDAEGVRMVSRDGQLWNHVSAQARYGLDNINAYRATGDQAYLTRAEAQAQRLIDRYLDVDGAWFHPYDWVWDAMVPPWYSALGQGYALSLFTRLYELTDDATYKTAADGTFASFLDAGPATTPWVSDVDPSGHLWLQEYPGGCECVFNGDMVAALGIYDYYRVTADPRALALFQGAATTVADYAASYRRAGWRSLYCLGSKLVTAKPAYHEVVVQQLLTLFTITGDPRFARWADAFESDYPRAAVKGKATVAAGKHTAVEFASSGAIVARRTISLRKTLHVWVGLRERIHNQPGYWLQISAGKWKRFWVEESAPKVFLPGQLVTLDYSPSRSLTLPAAAARYVFNQYSPSGAVTSTIKLSVAHTATIQVSARATVDGVVQVCATTGGLAGYWVPLKGCSLR